MTDIQPIIKRKQLVGWSVQVDGQSVAVDLAELTAPAYPTEHQVRHTARCKLKGEPSDRVAFAASIDQAHQMALADHELALAEWERSETIRRHCCRLAAVDWKVCEKLINAYQDRTNIKGFDDAAMSAAYEIPDLNWDPGADNGEALWAIVSAPPLPRPKLKDKPRRTDAAVRNIAIGLYCFAPSAEAVPF